MVKATISKWGNSEGIRIPKEIRDTTGLHEGSSVYVEANGDRIIITPVQPNGTRIGRYRVPDLTDLFDGYDNGYIPREDGFVAPAGREEL
ncbi:AbrB/MazE/SpoVT family DNA-binding domain-containing protein [Bifidobacterium samirii]|uniref:Transcriptional regulator/antitoxin, MazE n=1 Tax=Bifidobacterium samirii TaxID=2306974 RepID=A0A430FV33_9BIFI|nr:AbrB/MazE/SpoVT family DNA-binding domain-containing protein [Bifidobacterium samirii]RSX57415.1 Transcriptional regulator/antitoxin, MazE [Bifidobacterium samirii]